MYKVFDKCFLICMTSYVEHLGIILGARPLSYDTLGGNLFARSGPWYLKKWVPSDAAENLRRLLMEFGSQLASRFEHIS